MHRMSLIEIASLQTLPLTAFWIEIIIVSGHQRNQLCLERHTVDPTSYADSSNKIPEPSTFHVGNKN